MNTTKIEIEIATFDYSFTPNVALFSTAAQANESYSISNDERTIILLADMDIYRLHRPITALTDKYVTLLMYVIGFPGNALAFVVWIQRRMRHSSGCYLAALAFVDFVFLSLQLVFELHDVWGVPTLNLFLVCEIFPVFFIASQHLSPLLVLGFTVERFVAVCYPFQRDRYCTTSRAIKVIGGLAGGCVTLHAVQAYFWHYDPLTRDCSPRATVMEGGSLSVWSVWSWVTELLVFALVPLAILALNVCVIREMRRVKRREQRELCLRRPNLDRTNTQETVHGGIVADINKGRLGRTGVKMSTSSATTVMLLAVSFYLIVTTLPVTICYVLYLTFPAGSTAITAEQVTSDPTWQRYFSYISVKTVVQEVGMSHYACNVVIYVLTGRMFRRELRRLFSRVLLQQQHSLSRQRHHGDAGYNVSRHSQSVKSSLSLGGSSERTCTSSLIHSPSSTSEYVSTI